MLEQIIFYLLLIDAVGANIMSFFGNKWYAKHFRFISKHFPATKGWTLYYLVLVLWIGYLVFYR